MNELDLAREKVLRENTAQTVWKYLEDLDNYRSVYASKWIWELIQNARDAAREDNSLIVEASISDSVFTFRHNGAPFREEEIAHLIYYGSSKRDPNFADPIGRFGSGFLTSHLLAKRVSVNGIMHDRRRFSFVLSREGVSPYDLSLAMDQSWEDFKRSLRDDDGSSDFTTEYRYPLSQDTLPLATSGLHALDSLVPYTLAFNVKLREIRTAQSGKTLRTWIPDDRKQDDFGDGVSLVLIRSEHDGETIDRSVAIATNDGVSVAVIMDRLKGKPNVALDPLTPRLFVAFPLFGTERFCFPAVINSERFTPQEKRDGIYLGIDQTEVICKNKALIESACGLYVTLLHCSGCQGWLGIQQLALLPDLVEHQWLDQSWYRQLLVEGIIRPAREAAIVLTHDGALKSPRGARIPIEDSGVTVNEIWELSASLEPVRESLPAQADADGWSLVVKQWASVLSQKAEDLEESWTIEKLAQQIANLQSVEHLQTALINGQEPFEWLNQLYKLLAKTQRSDLFDKLPLLPDQNGTFRIRTFLRIDGGIDTDLKDIAAKLGVSAREELADTRIDLANIPKLPKKTEEELLSQLIQRVTAKPETHAESQPYREANVALFGWLLHRSNFDNLEGFPCLNQNTDPENHYLIKVTRNASDPEQIPLGPPALWPEKARKFLELFPDRYIVSQAYFDACPDTQAWEAFAAEGFIRCDPVFDSRGDDVELLESEPLTETDSGEPHRIGEDVAFSSISFLSTKNMGVIDRARGSQVKARQLLHFLAEYVVHRDQIAFDLVRVSCHCGSTHSYYRGGWLRPLRERTWVPIGEKQHDRANAESLAKLLHEESEFLRHLAQGEAAEIIQAFGIGQSALLLRVGTENEAERVELVASALDLNDALGNDTAKLRAIVDVLRNDPEVLDDIEKSSARRRIVRRNQAIGKEVEKHLKEILEASDTGLKVTRRHIGHDFEIENDVIDEGTAQPAEVGLEITTEHASFLVEVKASTADQFRMTPKQAGTAVNQEARFVLCMVQISKGSEISADDVLSGARFVPYIGKELKGLWRDFSTLETLKQQAPKRSGDIELEIDDSKARFRVGRETWGKGMPFDEAIRFFRGVQVPSDDDADSQSETTTK